MTNVFFIVFAAQLQLPLATVDSSQLTICNRCIYIYIYTYIHIERCVYIVQQCTQSLEPFIYTH